MHRNKPNEGAARIGPLDHTLVYEVIPRDRFITGDEPFWRIRIEPVLTPEKSFGLDIFDEIIIGRGESLPNTVDLSALDAFALGISRQHLILRPADGQLLIIDPGSTNGTRRGSQKLWANTPYPLHDGDEVKLGALRLRFWIVTRPRPR